MPINKFMHYGMLLGYPEAYYELRNTEKARKTTEELAEVFKQKLNYYSQFENKYMESIFDEIENNLLMYDQLVTTAIQYDETEYSDKLLRNFLEKVSSVRKTVNNCCLLYEFCPSVYSKCKFSIQNYEYPIIFVYIVDIYWDSNSHIFE